MATKRKANETRYCVERRAQAAPSPLPDLRRHFSIAMTVAGAAPQGGRGGLVTMIGHRLPAARQRDPSRRPRYGSFGAPLGFAGVAGSRGPRRPGPGGLSSACARGAGRAGPRCGGGPRHGVAAPIGVAPLRACPWHSLQWHEHVARPTSRVGSAAPGRRRPSRCGPLVTSSKTQFSLLAGSADCYFLRRAAVLPQHERRCPACAAAEALSQCRGCALCNRCGRSAPRPSRFSGTHVPAVGPLGPLPRCALP